MAYRNGTYVAFHANGTKEPTESDMKYYNLLKCWHVRADNDFHFVNSHDKTSSVRDSSKRATLQASLKERLRNSKNMILIVGKTTHEDADWVPFEIAYAVDECKIPLIVAYTGYDRIMAPSELSHLWPDALASRIRTGAVHAIHVPFKQAPLADAASQFSHTSFPKNGSLGYYSEEAYRSWGLL